MKILLLRVCFIGSVLFALSATSRAAPLGSGFQGGSFHDRFVVHNAGPAFRMGRGIRRDFTFQQNRRFFRRDHRFFSRQFAWPVYWYPYYYSDYYPWDNSYLDYGPDYGYHYGDDSAAPAQFLRPAAAPTPIVIVINQGNSRPTDSSSSAPYANSNYGSTAVEAQQRIVLQKSNEQAVMRADPSTSVSPAAAQATQATAQSAQAAPQAKAGIFGKLVLVSWLEDSGKDVIFVQNIETNEVQRITSEPNIDNFRIVEVHPNTDPKQFEAVISNGSEQGPVRFRF